MSNGTTSVTPKAAARVVAVTAALLSIPLMAMIFSWQVIDPGNPVPERVDWNLFDFIVMGTLMLSIGFTYELLKNKVPKSMSRVILALALLSVFFLIWAELAVGVFGSLFAGS